jgi:hypothetical protein
MPRHRGWLDEGMSDAPSGHADSHGNTPAAWTTVVIIIIAFTTGTLGIILGNWVIFWASVGLVAIGAIVGKVMQSMGLGSVPKA